MAGAGLARRVACLLVGAVLVSSRPSGATAQSLEGDEGGTVAAGLLLRQMNGVKRVLMIGAHPDDEDTSLLTALARGEGVQTAYLSLTRGEGGQNLLGPELWDGLGIIRTGELEAARKLDGGIQFFSRAFDFGFSKTAEETLTFWPHDEILKDVVWIIRKFRPQVVVTVFTGTPRDGHGNHQAAGILAREAFDIAGDPARFPEQLQEGVEAWKPRQALPAHPLERDAVHHHRPDRRVRPASGSLLLPTLHGEPQPAPVPGHGQLPAAGTAYLRGGPPQEQRPGERGQGRLQRGGHHAGRADEGASPGDGDAGTDRTSRPTRSSSPGSRVTSMPCTPRHPHRRWPRPWTT